MLNMSQHCERIWVFKCVPATMLMSVTPEGNEKQDLIHVSRELLLQISQILKEIKFVIECETYWLLCPSPRNRI
jgi:hypothetical protein